MSTLLVIYLGGFGLNFLILGILMLGAMALGGTSDPGEDLAALGSVVGLSFIWPLFWLYLGLRRLWE